MNREETREQILDDLRNNPDDWETVAEVPAAPDSPRPMTTVALRLETSTVDQVKQLAGQRGVGYTTLLRSWIEERIDLEQSDETLRDFAAVRTSLIRALDDVQTIVETASRTAPSSESAHG